MQHLGMATASAAGAKTCPAMAQPRSTPNLVLVLADDMGFSDAGCFGGEIETPTLDALAAGGTRFTQMYSAARCGPSRNSLLTGMYAQQTAADVMTPGKIPDYVSFLPEHLKKRGYRSYHSGKWHMRLACRENGVGFDRTYTMLDENRYFTQHRHRLDDDELPPPGPGYYGTTAITDYALDFLKGHQTSRQGEPFFLYLAYHAPHFPLQAPQEDIAHYKGRFDDGWDAMRHRRHQRMREMGLINCDLAPLERNVRPPWNLSPEELTRRIGPGEVPYAVPWDTLTLEQKKFQSLKMSIHAAMITRMDHETGRVVEQLRQMGVFEDTVILFFSDNGASAEEIIRGDGHDPQAPPGSASTHLSIGPAWATAADTPLRLHKSWTHEGGISSPMIVSWPHGIRNGTRLRHDPCHFVDVLPTFVDLAGGVLPAPAADAPPFPGVSLAKAIRSGAPVSHDPIYFNHNGNHALRSHDWKLVSRGDGPGWELYDMRTDRCEQKNLETTETARARSMEETWKALDEKFVAQREAAAPANRKMMPEGDARTAAS